MRARAAIDRIGRGDRERDAVVSREIPYQVNKARLIEKIAELVHEKKLDGISELSDESNARACASSSNSSATRFRRSCSTNFIKLTPMQSSFGIINIAIVDGQPKVLNLKQMLEAFVAFRREDRRKEPSSTLRKAQARRIYWKVCTKRSTRSIHHSADSQFRARWMKRKLADGNFATLLEIKNVARRSGGQNSCGIFEGTAQSRWRSAFYRYSGTGDSRFAIAQIVGARTSENHRRTGGDYEIHRRARSDLANDQLLRQVIVDELQEVKKNFGDARRTEIVDAGASSCESKI
jgi:DNA gyrase subunit A